MLKPKRFYSPVLGPQHRRRLLRELTPSRGRKFGVSPSEVRRSAAKMLGFKPLVSLSSPEQKILKLAAKETALRSISSQLQKAQQLLSGELKEEIDYFGPSKTVLPPEVQGIFHNAKKYNDERFVDKNSSGSLSFYGSRDLKGYLDEGGIDVFTESRRLIQQLRRPIRVLDVGSFSGQMLFELKKNLGKNVETHALSPDDVPKDSADFFHLLMAEWLPVTFRKKFDLIVSLRSLEYATFPHLGLANIAESLAKGGRAIVQFRPGRNSFLTRNFENLPQSIRNKPIYQTNPELLKFLQITEWSDENKVSLDQVTELIKKGMKRDPLETLQSIAWVNQFLSLRNSSDLMVKVRFLTMGPFGWIPGKFTIDRRR